MQDTIERELLIEAPVRTVWGVVTDPAQIPSWFADKVELDVRPGATGRFFFVDGDTGAEQPVNVLVEVVEEPSRFVYRWDFPDGAEPDDTNAHRVEITLEPVGGSTRLRLVESGFATAAGTGEQRQATYDDHVRGWGFLLPRLVDHASTGR